MEVALQDASFTKVCPRCGARLFRDMHICYGCLYDFDHPQPIERPPHELVQEAEPAAPEESEKTAKERVIEAAAPAAEAVPDDAGDADDTLDLSQHSAKKEKAASPAFTYLVRAHVGELEATVPIGERGVTIGRAQEKISENTLTDNFAKREFKELWARINRKHAYTVSFSDDELRRKSIERINSDLRVSRLQYTLTVGGQKSQATRDEVQAGSSFGSVQTETRDVDAGTASVGVTYDLVGEVAQAAAITRRSAATILAGIDANVFGLYRVNPEEFIKKAAALIVSEKATMVVEHISYHEIDDVYDEAIFTERMPDNASKAYEAKKNIQRFVFPDSDGERRFAEDMDAAAEVAVYAKLPRTFQIPTPVGNYAPDWAIAFKEGSVRHVFFIAETKGTMDTMELSGVENAKIACAKKLFNEMSTSDVRYHNVATYEDLLEVMGRMS